MRQADRPRLRDDSRERLAKLLGMCGSSHDGEALAAARMADKLVRDLGVTWYDVVSPAAMEPNPEPPERHIDVLVGWPVRWRAAAKLVAEVGEVKGLREKDVAFARVVSGYAHRPTERQLGYLADLVFKVLAAGGVR